MSLIRVTKEFTFEMAHALMGYDGPCKYIHGHSYGLAVTVQGEPLTDNRHPRLGMVIDFGDLKKIVKQQVVDLFDHALVLHSETPSGTFNQSESLFEKVIFVNYQPTSENLVVDFAARIQQHLPKGLKLHSVRLRETATCYAEWFAADNE